MMSGNVYGYASFVPWAQFCNCCDPSLDVELSVSYRKGLRSGCDRKHFVFKLWGTT